MICRCLVCGIEFYNNRRKLKTCSPECRKIYKSNLTKKQMSDPKARENIGFKNSRDRSGAWIGGSSPATYQKIAFEDYKFERKCIVCGSENKISVHHKDRNKKNNTKENLVVLCDPCHKRIHIKDGEMGRGIVGTVPQPKIIHEMVVQLFKNGKTIKEIAKGYGYTTKGIIWILKKYGIETPKPIRHDNITIEMISTLLMSGLSKRQTAISLGVTHTWITNKLKKDRKRYEIT